MADDTSYHDAAAQSEPAADEAASFAKGAADRMREAGEQARTAFQDRVAEPVRRAGEVLREGGQKVAQNNQAIGLKIIEQAESNAHQVFAAMRKAAQANDVSSVMQIQGDFLREQATRSMTQAREIGELIAQFGRDAVITLRGGGGQG
ncbi:phasin family protein [Sphingomonas bacterium]|uniref:phasin family protein n=1 Tax=Sphingomonas bacterium TaxID=1895847 RepID=UPI001575B037|nr:phasin family protein [Sphingomonas bacterium]